MFEPVPSFYSELSSHWAGDKSDLGYDATLHNSGLGTNK